MAVKALDEIINKKSFSNDIIKETINNVDDVDKGFYRKIIYGVVENLLYIDYVIGKLSNIPFKKMDKHVLNILRIAIYEIIFLESPSYAVINEAVNNTKKFNFKSKGFVNGVLRNLDRNIDKYTEIELTGDELLSVKYSTNMEIINYLKDNYENYAEIVSSFTKTPSLSIRVNSNLISKDELLNKLKDKGLKLRNSELAKDAIIVENPENITELDEFKSGLFTIQDQASILVSEILNPISGTKVLDLCAAPGSKSTHILQLMNDDGLLVSNDIAVNKNHKVIENFERLKLNNFKLTNYDASIEIEEFNNQFDYILVDAPCSGLGVVKRKPEIKLNRSYEDIEVLSKLQARILENAYKYLKPGGEIVYSTCTLGRLENEDIVEDFLENHTDMQIEKLSDNNYISLLPDSDNDGFFICKMLKIA